MCQENQFLCENKKCIPDQWKCNGIDDCGDQSDEDAKNCKGITNAIRNKTNGVKVNNLMCFLFRKSLRDYINGLIQHKKLLFYYMVPSFLYCFYNNLSFANLISFDPTSYFMFLQARLLITGVIYQV